MDIFQMKSADFKYLMSAMKLSVSKSYDRPVLQNIGCKISDGFLTALSCDGYRLHSLKLPCTVVEGNFDNSFILPITNFRNLKSNNIQIGITENEVLFDFFTEKWIKRVENVKYPDFTNAIPKDESKFEIHVDPRFLQKACEAFKSSKSVKIEFRGELTPIILKRSDEDFICVLPVRNTK